MNNVHINLQLCCHYTNNCGNVTNLYPSVINTQPKLKDLYNLITPEYAAHWKVIGTLLGIERGIITGIEKNYPNNVSWCCNDLLGQWLERDTEATWKIIIQAIDSPAVTSLVSTSTTPVVSSQYLSGNYTSI